MDSGAQRPGTHTTFCLAQLSPTMALLNSTPSSEPCSAFQHQERFTTETFHSPRPVGRLKKSCRMSSKQLSPHLMVIIALGASPCSEKTLENHAHPKYIERETGSERDQCKGLKRVHCPVPAQRHFPEQRARGKAGDV